MENAEIDYNLYQILDKNGFMPTKKNLADFKEGLASGLYVALDSSCLDLTEAAGEYVSEAAILEANGYDVTDENIEMLEQMIGANRVLLY